MQNDGRLLAVREEQNSCARAHGCELMVHRELFSIR